MARILVVDDVHANRLMLTRFLQLHGHEAISSNDGAQALLRIWQDPPDLILLDLCMPVFDGWATARYLQASPETGGIPIIAVTADTEPAARERALAAGCADYVTKPVDLPELAAKILALLSLRRLSATRPGSAADGP